MFKQLATAAAAVVLGFGGFAAAPAEAYTKACGSHSVVFKADSNSPRYFANAWGVQIHDGGAVSYHVGGLTLSVKGRWYREDINTVVVQNPDGSYNTFKGVTGACNDWF